MPRRHALQPRPGVARSINVRVTDAEHARLARLAKRQGKATVSQLVRRAIETHVLKAEYSPFFTVFGRVIEDLGHVDVHPILVGSWAAAAHGYLAPAGSFDLVIRAQEVESLRAFLAARGAKDAGCAFPFSVGREPWRISFAEAYGGTSAEALPTVSFAWESTELQTLTLEALTELGVATLEEYVLDALVELRDGRHKLDDGERGVVAWDAMGRLTSSAWYADPLTRDPHCFVDFREMA